MVTIEDASRRRRIAEKAFEDHDWSNCVLNAQMCIELSLKSLLDTLEIKYNKGHRDYLHPLEKLSENIDKICEKLQIEQEFEKNLIARDFIRALLWQGIGNIAQGFGPKGVAVKDLFEKEEAQLASSHAYVAYSHVSGYIYKYKYGK